MDGWSLSLMAAKGFSMSQFAANRCGYQSRIKDGEVCGSESCPSVRNLVSSCSFKL
jgi:hypothetical protein